jgi:hypothetical protein
MLFVLWFRLWPYIVLALACVVVFGRALGGDFLSWDDTTHITMNPWLLNGEISHFWKSEYYGLYIPLTYTTWTILYKIWPSAVAFHLLNLIVHIVNCWLAFWIAHKVLSSRKKDSVEMLESGRNIFALLAALVFAIHPFQVETVAWISGGRDLLGTCFGLMAVIAAWNTADRLFPSWAAVVRRVLATLLFVFSLLCKPALAALPPAVKWLSWFTERRGLKWTMMWVWLGLGALVAGMTMQVQSDFITTRLSPLHVTDKIAVALDAIGFYLRKFFIADFFSADYGRSVEAVLAGQGSPWLVLLGLIVAFAIAWLFLPGPIIGGLGFFVLMLFPVLGFWGFSAQAFSTVYDRYMYLPILGLGIAFASIVSEVKIRWELRLAVAFAICGWWGWISFQHVPVWTNNQALFEDVLKTNPKSYNGLVNLALVDVAAARLPEARAKLEAAREVNPRLAVALANLSHVYWLEKNPQEVRKIAALLADAEFIAYNKHEPQALSLVARMLGRVRNEAGQTELGREALCYATQLNPFDKDLKDEIAALLKANDKLKPCQ